MKTKRSGKVFGILAALAVVILVIAGTLLFSMNWMRYTAGSVLSAVGEYDAAITLFSQTEGYRDTKERLQECHYGAGLDAFSRGEYETAVLHFSESGHYRDTENHLNESYYAIGHEAFLDEDYEAAETAFSSLTHSVSEYGEPHFKTMEDAADYLMEAGAAMKSTVTFCLGEEGDEEVIDVVQNLLSCQYFDLYYQEENHVVTVKEITYYPGDRILSAYRAGNTDALSEKEQEVLTLALEVVQEAEEQTDSDLEKERFLHDWICERVKYENPDMEIEREDYIKLTELSCIGTMLEGKANCQGYADTFYLLGNLAGFEVRRLFGETDAGHVWNCIRFDGKDYIVDVTFDDLSGESVDGWTYIFFNTHWDPNTYTVWGSGIAAPDLSLNPHEENGYFEMTGTSFEDVDDAMDSLVDQNLNEGNLWSHVQIKNQILSEEECGDLLYEEVDGRYYRSVSWLVWWDHYAGSTYLSVCWDPEE